MQATSTPAKVIRVTKWPLIFLLLLASYRYVWWLGAHAWYPAPSVHVLSNGVKVRSTCFASDHGFLAILWENDKKSGSYVIDQREPPLLYYGIRFKEYGFFALPVGSIGVPVAATNPKTEHDPKLRRIENGFTFLDLTGHEIQVQLN